MNDIKIIKLTSGEEIIANIVVSDNDTIEIKEAVALMYQQLDGGRMSVGFAPYMPYANDNITLYKSAIASTASVKGPLLAEYNRSFSNIIIAPAGSI